MFMELYVYGFKRKETLFERIVIPNIDVILMGLITLVGTNGGILTSYYKIPNLGMALT